MAFATAAPPPTLQRCCASHSCWCLLHYIQPAERQAYMSAVLSPPPSSPPHPIDGRAASPACLRGGPAAAAGGAVDAGPGAVGYRRGSRAAAGLVQMLADDAADAERGFAGDGGGGSEVAGCVWGSGGADGGGDGEFRSGPGRRREEEGWEEKRENGIGRGDSDGEEEDCSASEASAGDSEPEGQSTGGVDGEEGDAGATMEVASARAAAMKPPPKVSDETLARAKNARERLHLDQEVHQPRQEALACG